MKTPVPAFRTNYRSGTTHACGEIAIPVTRGNADLLTLIAERTNELQSVNRYYGASTLTAETSVAGALVLQLIPLGTFLLRKVLIECGCGQQPKITLVDGDEGYLMLNWRGDLDLRALAEDSQLPLSEADGEIECPNCGFVNTKAGLAAPHGDCFKCGMPAHEFESDKAPATASPVAEDAIR